MKSPPRLHQKETLLLIVDLQERLLPAMPDSAELTRCCVQLATAARQLKLPVIVTEQNPQRLGPTVEALRAIVNDAPLEKMRFSACTEETMRVLQTSNCRSVIVCGVEAHVCVMQTTLDLLAADYNVFVPRDAIASRRELDANMGFERMLRAGVVPSTVESVVFELLHQAGTPDFKALLPLLK